MNIRYFTPFGRGRFLKGFICFLLAASLLFRQSEAQEVRVCTWNIQYFGQTKTEQDLRFIADMVAKNDIVAIQEVVAVKGGVHAVIRLKRILDSLCKSCAWDYSISPITSGNAHQKERYAYLWKRNSVKKIGHGWLDQHFEAPMEREPYLSEFEKDGRRFTLVSYHALPKSKQPETEIKYLKFFPTNYPRHHLIFFGDFNLPQNHSVFNPLKKMGYRPALINQKTTLRQRCLKNDCLASEYDNFFYPPGITKRYAGVIHFYRYFNDLKEARKISDHLPTVFIFTLP